MYHYYNNLTIFPAFSIICPTNLTLITLSYSTFSIIEEPQWKQGSNCLLCVNPANLFKFDLCHQLFFSIELTIICIFSLGEIKLTNPTKKKRWNFVDLNDCAFNLIIFRKSLWDGFSKFLNGKFNEQLHISYLWVLTWIIVLHTQFNPLSSNPTKWQNTTKQFEQFLRKKFP